MARIEHLVSLQDLWQVNVLHDIILAKSKIKHAKQNQVSRPNYE